MRIVHHPLRSDWPALFQRASAGMEALEVAVAPILDDVRERGDAAVRDCTRRFDGVELDDIAIPPSQIAAAAAQVSAELQAAIRLAAANIEKFHAGQREAPIEIETMPGVRCWRRSVAIESVGLYIPGGTAPLFSSLLMLGIPAKLAGCRDIAVCTPPGPDGDIHPAILFTAHLLGLSQVFAIGGAQAIAALAYGTETVPRVHKIFGPGNSYVTAAKLLVNRAGVAIDLPAGPTELAIIADSTSNPAFVAADVLSQAEHGADSQVLVVTDDAQTAAAVQRETARQLEALQRREIAAAALQHSAIVVVANLGAALALVNEYAPEHLILAVERPEALAKKVVNAGSVFLGHFAPESAGDYASGTNHTLPTSGYAAAYSGVSLDSFVKKITYQAIDTRGIRELGPAVELMAEAEGLVGHKNAVSIRLAHLDADRGD